ncbi:MAG: hypothetical protein ACKOV8_04825, partial [Phycisphaerales bacterium]
MDAFIDALWQLVSEPGLLRENLANVVDTLGGPLTYAMLGLIVFCETGLVVTPYMPADSLIFAVCSFSATEGSPIDPSRESALLIVAA